MTNYIEDLNRDGYAIIPNIITSDEIEEAREYFFSWKNKLTEIIPNFLENNNKLNPHNIFKFHEVGHQRFMWFLRTRPKIQDVFKRIWNTEELTVGFDGCCWMPSDLNKKDNIWTHTDQAPAYSGMKCIQGFVALTSNQERTLRVYKGSHNLHQEYFTSRNIDHKTNWELIDHDYLDRIKDTKINLNVPAGSLVLWDSRTFHQNQYGCPGEERIVCYISYLPKNNPINNETQQRKRRKYFEERRTTSHWAYPIKVNSKQPQIYGNQDLKIDYDVLPKPDLEDLLPEIEKVL